MFNSQFYPTPEPVIEQMLDGETIEGKNILEPSAGKGDIVSYLKRKGAKSVIACEKDTDLHLILKHRCAILANDFLTVTADMVSHIDMIVMNPPFSADETHILHAYAIAPPECTIVALCNWQTVKNTYTNKRKELVNLINQYGTMQNLGEVFAQAERFTKVETGLIRIKKSADRYKAEFDGFFTEQDPAEGQQEGIMPYNIVRDIVNRYVEAVKIFDNQLTEAQKMHSITSGFYSSKVGMNISKDDAPVTRDEFKKDLQKSAWRYVFDKLNGYGLYCSGGLEALNWQEALTMNKSTAFQFTHLPDIATSRCSTLGGYLAETILRSTKSSFFIFLGRVFKNYSH